MWAGAGPGPVWKCAPPLRALKGPVRTTATEDARTELKRRSGLSCPRGASSNPHQNAAAQNTGGCLGERSGRGRAGRSGAYWSVKETLNVKGNQCPRARIAKWTDCERLWVINLLWCTSLLKFTYFIYLLHLIGSMLLLCHILQHLKPRPICN